MDCEVKSVVIIPARYLSTRFPGKPLVKLLGKPMVLWVTELAAAAVGKDSVFVATEDNRIAEVVRSAGFNAVMTSPEALTGTDRVAEAAQQIDSDIYLNVQGDEPIVSPLDILKVRDEKLRNPGSVVNGFCWLGESESPENFNLPKVVTNEQGRLLYISRSAIPGCKVRPAESMRYKKQVCIYAYSKSELSAFFDFGRKSELESREDIEILRFFELGVDVQMVETSPGTLAVDCLEDIPAVERALANTLDVGPAHCST